MGSVLAGENADEPSPYDFALGGAGLDPSLPISSNGSIMKPGNTIMVDIGGNFTGYMSDMSRVFSFGRNSGESQRSARCVVRNTVGNREDGKTGCCGIRDI